MTSETAISAIKTVKKKLQKYTALKEHEKVKEYLRKLHHTSVTPALLQETRIDILVRQLASNKTANYNSSARILLKKWHHKKLLPKSTKVKTTTTTVDSTETIIEEKSPAKQKSDDETANSNGLSESQLSDDNKKRKVLSLAEYLESKKHVSSPSSTIKSSQNKLTDTQIEVINAQFNATTEKLAASVPDLASVVNKNLIQTEKLNSNRNNFIATKATIEQSNRKVNDLWAEDEDDDDDDYTQPQIIQSKTVNAQKVR